MIFANYTGNPTELAADLVNTYGVGSGTEFLESPEELDRFLSRLPGVDYPGKATVADLERVRTLRSHLRSVFESPDPETASVHINAILEESGARPVLTSHGDSAHLHFQPSEDDPVSWLAVITAIGMATTVADEDLDRLGICEADGCRDVFFDLSRNRSRRHCSDTCRTRANVAAYRQRRRSEG